MTVMIRRECEGIVSQDRATGSGVFIRMGNKGYKRLDRKGVFKYFPLSRDVSIHPLPG